MLPPLTPTDGEARLAIEARLVGTTCRAYAREIIEDQASRGWELAYALAPLSVAGGTP